MSAREAGVADSPTPRPMSEYPMMTQVIEAPACHIASMIAKATATVASPRIRLSLDPPRLMTTPDA